MKKYLKKSDGEPANLLSSSTRERNETQNEVKEMKQNEMM